MTTNIHHSYRELKVLNGINLNVKKGEFVSIIGASGAGKSTLLHILGTLEKPTKGHLEINNQNLSNFSDKKLSEFRNNEIGFIFQFHNLLSEFTAFENICIPGYISKKSKKEVENNAIELMKKLNIDNRQHHKPNELSGGEQQRVAIARSLINSPSIILADEPTGNLDSKNSSEIHHLLSSLNKTLKQTIIVVTHNTELSKITDRQILISDGIILDQ